MGKYVDGIEFVTEECANCGMPFAMTKDFQRRRLNDRKSFHCPAGHGQHYTGKTEEQKLRERLEAEQRKLTQTQVEAVRAKAERDAAKKAHRKMRERVRNGVCPCCNRTFQNLLRHMETKHPDFGGGKSLKVMRDAYGLTQAELSKEVDVPVAYVSLYENERFSKIPDYANALLDSWLEQQK